MPVIRFNMEPQQHSEWCWAAVAVSVERFFAPDSTWCQRRMASRMAKALGLRVNNCGTCKETKALPRTCNRPWYLQKALKLVGRLNGKPKAGHLSFAETERKIKAGRPVCIRIQFGPNPNGHFVVISGCERAKSGNRWVDVEDSFAGSSIWLYDEFRTNYEYSQGVWSDTFPV